MMLLGGGGVFRGLQTADRGGDCLAAAARSVFEHAIAGKSRRDIHQLNTNTTRFANPRGERALERLAKCIGAMSRCLFSWLAPAEPVPNLSMVQRGSRIFRREAGPETRH